MLRGTLADFTDGSMLVDEGWAENEGLSVGDTYTLDKTPKGKLELRVAGIYAENPVIFFPTVTTLATLKDQRVPDVRQRPDPRRRRATPSACRPASTRSSRTSRSSPSRTRRPSPTSSAPPSTSWC